MHSNSIRRSAIVALAALLAPLSLPAEPVTVSTVPFGGMILEIPAGTSIVSDVFIGSALYQGPVASSSGDGSVELGNLPAIEHPAYVHVLSGTDEGMVSTILDADNDSVTVETALNVEVGDIVAIRKHQTVGEFFAGAELSLSDNDRISLYNSDGTISVLEYFDGFGWYDRDFNEADDVIIFPTEGFVINAQSDVSVVLSGSVTTHPMKAPFATGLIAMIPTLNPAGAVTIGDLFGNELANDSTVTLYETLEGSLNPLGSYEYYEDFGFFDRDFNAADNVLISVGGVSVLRSSNSGHISIPPSYAP